MALWAAREFDLRAWPLIIRCCLHQFFSIHYFFSEGKKVKGWLGMMCLGDGVGRCIDFSSVHPSVHPWHVMGFKSHVYLATLCSYPTQKNCALIYKFLSIIKLSWPGPPGLCSDMKHIDSCTTRCSLMSINHNFFSHLIDHLLLCAEWIIAV